VNPKLLHRSRAAVALSNVGEGQVEIAQKIGVSRSYVGHWQTGRRVPAFEQRVAIRKAYPAILEQWWDEPATPESAPIPAPVPPEEPAAVAELAGTVWGPGTVRARAEWLAALLERMCNDLTAAEKEGNADRVSKYARSIAPTLALLGKITGETQTIDESRIVRLPAFQRVSAHLVKALTPWPEAMHAVGVELQRLGGES
jgi:hypothetical protein